MIRREAGIDWRGMLAVIGTIFLLPIAGPSLIASIWSHTLDHLPGPAGAAVGRSTGDGTQAGIDCSPDCSRSC